MLFSIPHLSIERILSLRKKKFERSRTHPVFFSHDFSPKYFTISPTNQASNRLDVVLRFLNNLFTPLHFLALCRVVVCLSIECASSIFHLFYSHSPSLKGSSLVPFYLQFYIIKSSIFKDSLHFLSVSQSWGVTIEVRVSGVELKDFGLKRCRMESEP